jgi:uncharacterized protein (TIGR00255 family)
MIRSMTGFGRSELERDGVALTAEIRSVNHKFCEVSVRLPRSLSSFENLVRMRIQEMLSRGKINLTVNWKDGREHEGELVLDEAVAENYMKALERLRGRFNFSDDLDLRTLVGLPDIFQWREVTLDEEEGWALLRDLIDRAVTDLLSMREQEGQALLKDLECHVERILESLSFIESRAPLRVIEAKDKLRARIAQLLQGEGTTIPEERIVLEASFLADRLDCTEEVVRLKSHCEQFLDLSRGKEAAGRKLNFLIQEMNREINTIGSKANDLDIARQVITLKEEVEVVREQVQNIE